MEPIDTRGLITTSIDIPSTNFINEWSGGEDGIPPMFSGATIQQKQIEVTIELIAHDYLDYQLLRDELYGIFNFNKSLYIVDKRQRGKRHKVIMDSNFIPERHNLINGTAVIPFITCEPHFAESIGTTQDIEKNGVDANEGLWGFGMGLQSLDETYVYSFNVIKNEQFGVYNAGNILVHPFSHELKITISNVIGSTNHLELKNSNGTLFRINEKVDKNQTIVLDGANVTSNGLVIDPRTTNRGFIQLNPQWNWLSIKGADSARVSFDFRFYYY